MTLAYLNSFAAEPSLSSLADQEVQRRADGINTQQTRLIEAEGLLQQRKTEAALTLFEQAFTSLPNIPLAQETRVIALDGYIRAGLTRAKELTDAGDYPAAKAILDKLSASGVAPNDSRITSLRARLTDPDRYPPALTPEHIQRVNEVQRLLTLANSQFETGQYDKALASYEDVLRIDTTNTAARRGMEKVEQEQARYYQSAKDHQRSRMLNEVNGSWENTVRTDVSALFGGGESATASMIAGLRGGREAITQKLRDLKLEKIDFAGATLNEVLEYLRVRSRDLDPTGKGVDFVNNLPTDQDTASISLNLRQVPIEEVLRYVTEMANASFRIEDYAVRIISRSEDTGAIIMKSYKVPPDFISTAAVTPDASAAPADPFAAGAAAGGPGFAGLQIKRLGAQEFLQNRGVTFAEGTGANYSPNSNLLIVRNTAKQIELVDQLVEQALNSSPKQVVISVRVVEINQTNLEELGFDWLLEGFGSSIVLEGGTKGNQQTGAYPNLDFPNKLASGEPVGQNPVTAGLRSSGDLYSNQTIDDILYGATTAASRRSPAAFSLAGVLTNPQFQVAIRALDQKTGIDVMAKPEVVTKSGQKANVQVVRELIYPTEFDPPQIPTNVGTNTVLIDQNGNETFPPLPPIPVTPSTPTAFEMRRVGVVLDVEPVISEDNKVIDLTITPEITEFVGFVNYGSPINSVASDGVKVELTENRIFQPIFSSRKIATSVKVYDGATVVLGGLISDNNIMIDDKVPVAGDLPFVGRLFRSKVSQRRVKNMLFFVSVKVVDPSGARVSQ